MKQLKKNLIVTLDEPLSTGEKDVVSIRTLPNGNLLFTCDSPKYTLSPEDLLNAVTTLQAFMKENVISDPTPVSSMSADVAPLIIEGDDA